MNVPAGENKQVKWGREAVNLIQEQDDGPLDYADTPQDGSIQHGISVGSVNQLTVPAHSHSWDSDSSGDYLVMTIRSKMSLNSRSRGCNCF